MYSNTTYTLEELRRMCVASLDSSKATDIEVIDLKGNSNIADEMIIATGSSNRHVSGVADRLQLHLAQHDIHGVHMSGYEEGKWVIVDAGSIIVHILQESERQRYRLEDLYKCIAAGISEEDAL